MANDILEIQNVDAYYGESHVLHGLSLSLGEGRLLGLLGRNGAGKTTCMSTVMGFLPPKRGAVVMAGERVSGSGPETISRKGISLVPQGRRIFRSLTVKENLQVAERAPAYGRRSGTWNLHRVFEMFPRLKERHSQFAGSLSGGEQQMLAIGRALMSNPRVLLMDEPSEGLAPQIVADVGRIIAMLKGEGLSIILVEQNIKMTLNLADEIVIINTGRVAFSGTAAEAAADHELISRHLGVF